MGFMSAMRRLLALVVHEHGAVKSFEQEVEAARILGRVDGGMKTIPASKVVGSVGRAQNLRSDFFYRTGKAVTGRFVSIGKAMEQGKVLPPIEVYKAKLRRPRPDGGGEAPMTEYYVVDGHHRVAMARKLGQDYLDAHVVEYRVADATPAGTPAGDVTPTRAPDQPDVTAPDHAAPVTERLASAPPPGSAPAAPTA